ncbi:bidirectional sugar transporter NEC1-like [Impatiens glandulifera]|uniref:bidirectional sugar transporter NEC1-like n=1 Tax=Impatiens glandulifera TaxID=253017 RepID=UPI001FB06C54|nr:bidirectional sugar transporter NEC1-like [Impatiens glandulifera]
MVSTFLGFTRHELTVMFGVLGNIVSFMVYLAPLPTFKRIYKKKSTEGFQAVPYSVALFSAMLLLYYAFLKTSNGTMIITINSVGCVIEGTYLIVFLIYATNKARKSAVKLLAWFNVGAYAIIVVSTYVSFSGKHRETIVGWICAVFSVCVFAAPLSIMKSVIKSNSVEYMPFWLSFFLTLCAIMWFCYGFLIKDFFVATPNILGFGFGIAQMILYAVYRDSKKEIAEEKIQGLTDLTVTVDIGSTEHEVNPPNQCSRANPLTCCCTHDRQLVVPVEVDVAKPEIESKE